VQADEFPYVLIVLDDEDTFRGGGHRLETPDPDYRAAGLKRTGCHRIFTPM
jgi:hypothetical protein